VLRGRSEDRNACTVASLADVSETALLGRQTGTCGQELSNGHSISCLMETDIAELQCLSTGLARVCLRRHAHSAKIKLLGPTAKEKPRSVNCGL